MSVHRKNRRRRVPASCDAHGFGALLYPARQVGEVIPRFVSRFLPLSISKMAIYMIILPREKRWRQRWIRTCSIWIDKVDSQDHPSPQRVTSA